MRRACLAAIALLFLFCAAPAAAQQVEPGQSLTASIERVKDGDTFVITRSEGGSVTVRLWGVDAPEPDQPYGTAATEAARRLVVGKDVQVSIEDIGRYGQAAARIKVRGRDLGAMLVRHGLAWHHKEYAPEATEYEHLERKARNADRGVWSQTAPIPPWKWLTLSSGSSETSMPGWAMGLFGGIIGTLLTLYFSSRWRKEKRALQLTQFYLEKQEWFGEAKGLLERNDELDNKEENQISRAGDFWDYVALLYEDRMVDKSTLDNLSVPYLIARFYDKAEQSSSLESITPSEDWKYMKEVANRNR